ncbi:acriflavin resistance protein [Salipaludibacillus neizhouensis]|uniref:Acriflavin resistance protein n=2 Tax=Salipaludibacillus neizhouensis TaxID=885475 RepID=A0A3A9K4B7_9BACI|nr:acriflavin resistance protein [Salipaludibacillus neizhouensis]
MLMNLLRVLLERKLIVGLLVVFILGIGFYSIGKLDQELLPPVTMDGGIIYMESGSLTSSEVEERLTLIAEQSIEGVEGIDSYTSTSSEGLAVIQYFTDEGMGKEASLDVESTLQSITSDLPVTELTVQQFSTDQPYEFFMDISEGSINEMTTFANNVLKPRLEALPEVREVAFTGLQEKEWELVFDEDKLAEHELTVDQAIKSIQEVNLDLSLGELSDEEGQPSLRWEQSFQSIDDLMETRMGSVQIEDIAEVTEITSEIQAETWKNGDAGFIFTEIGRTDGFTQIDMANAVRSEVALINEENLVSGFSLNEIVNQADYVQDAIDGVTQSVLFGGIIAIIVLFLFLRNPRATIIVGLSIPLSLLLTFSTMWIIGYSLNMLSMIALGLGIGMMVDASIVIMESIYRKKENGFVGKEAVMTGVKEVASPVIASMLTTIVVFLPIGLFGGEMGAFIIVLSLVVVITLVSSLLISFTVIPTFSENFLKLRKNSTRVSDGPITQTYGKILQWVSEKKRRSIYVISLFLVILASSLFLTAKVPVTLMPDIFNRYTELTVDLETGLSAEEREDIADAIHFQLEDLQDVDSYIVMDNIDNFYVLVNLTKDNEITVSQDKVVSKVISSIRELEDETPISNVLSMMDTGGQQSIQMEVVGEDFEELQLLAEDVQNDLKTVEGVTNVVTSFKNSQETKRIVLDEDQLKNDGISKMTVLEKLTLSETVDPIAEIPSNNETSDYIPVFIKADESPKTIDNLLDVTVTSREGEKTLSEYVSFTSLDTPNKIERIDGKRVIQVTASIENRDLGSVNSELQELISNRKDLPGYEVQLSGDLETQQEAMNDLIFIFIISLFLVYVVMAIQFNSLKHPLIIMSIIPFTATGVILGLLVTQRELSVISAMGLLMLIGIILNNAILLVDRTNQLRREGLPIREAMVQAGKNRLRPIFMTTMTTVGGMLPLAILGGASAGYQAPLATVVISGLLFATTITLLLIPSIYFLVEREKQTIIQEARVEKIEKSS